MIQLILSRIAQSILIILAMTIIVFVGLNAVGNPVDTLIAPNAGQAERLRAIQALGLDQPLWKQYLLFLGNAMQGNLGLSFVSGEPALQLILSRLPATIELAVIAVFSALVIGVPIGMLAGVYPKSWLSRAIMGFSVVGFSLPAFWVALMLIIVFAVQLGWLPSSGRGETVSLLGIQVSYLTVDGIRHLILPAISLGLYKFCLVVRLVRAGVMEVSQMEYVKFARAKGLRMRRVIFLHMLKNIMIPVVTVVGLELGGTIAFAVVTESIFAWPGVGRLIIQSIGVLDRPVIIAYLMIVVVLFVVLNLLTDLAYAALDPRVRGRTA